MSQKNGIVKVVFLKNSGYHIRLPSPSHSGIRFGSSSHADPAAESSLFQGSDGPLSRQTIANFHFFSVASINDMHLHVATLGP